MTWPVLSDSSAVYWVGGTAPAVGEVCVEVSSGIDVVVDAADLSRLLSWRVANDGDLRAFADAVIETPAERTVFSARAGVETECDAFHLVPDWTRRALTVAVAKFQPAPLDEGALMLDEAGARYSTGDTLGAVQLVAVSSPTLETLADGSLNGKISSSAILELAQLAASARAATSDTDWGYSIAVLSERVRAIDTFDDDILISWLEELVEADAFDLVGSDLAGGEPVAAFETIRAYVDPHVVPARILKWSGARTPELVAEFDTGAVPSRVVLKAALAPGVDPLCHEANRLIGYAADSSGAIIVSTPMVPDANSVTGTLLLAEPDFRRVSFGIFDSYVDPRDLRLGPLASALIDADRNMIEAWSLSRSSVAALHAKDATDDRDAISTATSAAEGFDLDSVDAARRAIAALELVRGSEGFSETPLIGLVSTRIGSIERFISQVQTHLALPMGSHPLLSELVPPPQFDDTDPEDRN